MTDLMQFSAGAMFVKLIVDLLKLSGVACPTWAVVLAAVLSGQLVTLLLALSAGSYIGVAQAAGIVLDGLLATAVAMGVTEVHKAARGQG